MPHPAERRLTLLLLGSLLAFSGCASLRSRCESQPLVLCRLTTATPHAEVPPLVAGDDQRVDAYFQACAAAWHQLPSGGPAAQASYNTALHQLFTAAVEQRRLDPARGLQIMDGQRTVWVPIVQEGFAWQPADFQSLYWPPDGEDSRLARRYGCDGIGLPLVVERARRDCHLLEARFFPAKSYFGATLVLEFDEAPRGARMADSAELRFYDPFHVRRVGGATCPQPLAADHTAALALTLEKMPRTYFAGFVEPGGATTQARLGFLEPYQPGRIPVVLIHGLFSDPQSWADLINDLRAVPRFTERYQIWAFRYPTGRGFLQSAAALRRELSAAVETLDPEQRDPALRRMVLIGHSMGGLVAKLQVTHSGELIWNKLANRPLEEIVAPEQTRAFLAETCYFDPSPHVERVVFIATPHCGSTASSGLVGRTASRLVDPSPEQQAMHDQLMRDNPQTFNPLIESGLPTSIDMLSPQSPLLEVMRQLPLKHGLPLHNVIGVAFPLSVDGPTDGVVAVRSAEHAGCESVLAYNVTHAQAHRELRTSSEVLRILDLHSATLPRHSVTRIPVTE
jgi:pimeloyl-ACP methyl ester carboxylesterase